MHAQAVAAVMSTPSGGGRLLICHSLVVFGLAILSQAFSTYLLFVYAESTTLALGALVICRTIAGVAETVAAPIWGWLSDRAGRGRRPWLLLATPLAAIGVAASFAPPVSGSAALLVYFAVVTLTVDLALSVLWTNLSALFPALFVAPAARAHAAAWKHAALLAGYAVALVPIPAAFAAIGTGATGVLVALAGALPILGAIAFLREPPARPVRPASLPAALRSVARARELRAYLPVLVGVNLAFLLVGMALPFYARYTLGLSGAGTTAFTGAVLLGIVAALGAWGRLAGRTDPDAILRAGLWLAASGFVVILVVSDAYVAAAGGLVVGAGFAGSLVATELIGARVVTAASLTSERDDTGLHYSVLSFATRLATVTLVGPIFALTSAAFGYQGAEAPGPAPGMAFRGLAGGVPLVLHLALLAYAARRRDRSGGRARTDAASEGPSREPSL